MRLLADRGIGGISVRVFWDDLGKPRGTLSRDYLLKCARELVTDSRPPAGVNPEFSPREALGLYVYSASASFRRVIVEPLNEQE